MPTHMCFLLKGPQDLALRNHGAKDLTDSVHLNTMSPDNLRPSACTSVTKTPLPESPLSQNFSRPLTEWTRRTLKDTTLSDGSSFFIFPNSRASLRTYHSHGATPCGSIRIAELAAYGVTAAHKSMRSSKGGKFLCCITPPALHQVPPPAAAFHMPCGCGDAH